MGAVYAGRAMILGVSRRSFCDRSRLVLRRERRERARDAMMRAALSRVLLVTVSCRIGTGSSER